ncbi:MAG: ATP-binding protein [Ktedonobacteraceae bacterium]|nr:ATP-binding protein [Ktedonobacteraceae bacterium]
MSKLFIICGISFAGKTTLGKRIAQRSGYAEVDVDEVKVQLYGADIRDEDLRSEDWVRIYAETDRLIERYLKAGETVIDASRNFSKEERQVARQIAARLNVEVVTIFVDTPEAVARQRLLENRKQPSRREVTDKDFEAVLRAMEPPTADENPIVFRFGDSVERWIAQNVPALY